MFRGGSIGFEKVPVDGSSKMADDLMESIEPFNFNEAVDFQTAYLAGYLADKYDVDAEQSIIITSSIMTLVPGVAITNAIRDTLQGDYMSGISRVVEAFVIAAGIAVGIGFGLLLFGKVGGAWGWI